MNHIDVCAAKRCLSVLVLAVVSLVLSIATVAQDDNQDARALLAQGQQFFKPLPKDMSTSEYPLTPAVVALGRALFFDPRPSLDGTVSCARCHQPALYGTDALPKAIGAAHRLNARNALTVLNAALQFVQHWVGDRTSVEDQATQSLVGPASFGNPDYAAAVAKLKGIPGYQPLFAKAYPKDLDPITADTGVRPLARTSGPW